MATPSPDAVVTFMRITGASEFVAVQKLEEYGGNLNEAVNAHFLEGDRHLQEQNHVAAAAPHYNYSVADNQNQNRVGSRGILPLLNAARRFRPSLLLDSNYRRELRDLCNGVGATSFSSSAPPPPQPPHGSPQWEAREARAETNNAVVSPYQSDMNGNLSSRGRGIYGTDDYHNDYPPLSAQSNASHVRDQDIEEAMIQAAIEASKEERREISSWNAPNDSSGDRLPQNNIQGENDDLAHALSLSLKTAEEEEAMRELLVKEETKGLEVHSLLAKGEKTNSSGSRLELGTSSNQNGTLDVAQPVIGNPSNLSASSHHSGHEDMVFAEKWGGISSDELNEALMIENELFGEIPNQNPHNISSLPDLQHHPEKNVDPKMQCSSSSTSQLLIETQLLRQQQDADYLASLQADKQKELNSFKEAEAHSESRKKMLERKELEKIPDTKKVILSSEPPLGDEKAITIVVRMPNGGRCERRFLKTDKLQLLFDFIDNYGAVKPGTYRVVKSYPRQAYNVNDGSATLNEVGLNKNEALFLELI